MLHPSRHSPRRMRRRRFKRRRSRRTTKRRRTRRRRMRRSRRKRKIRTRRRRRRGALPVLTWRSWPPCGAPGGRGVRGTARHRGHTVRGCRSRWCRPPLQQQQQLHKQAWRPSARGPVSGARRTRRRGPPVIGSGGQAVEEVVAGVAERPSVT